MWLLGKIPGRGQHYVHEALASDVPQLRVLALRLARQLADVEPLPVVQRLVRDGDPFVRRECAIALRFEKRPAAR